MDLDYMSNEFSMYMQRRLSRFPPSHHSSPLVVYPQRHILRILAGDNTIPRIKLFSDFIRELEKLYFILGNKLGLTDEPDLLNVYFLNTMCRETGEDPILKKEFDKLYICLTTAISEVKDDLCAVTKSHPALKSITNLLTISSSQRDTICQRMMLSGYSVTILAKTRQTIQQNHLKDNKELTCVVSEKRIKIYVISEIALFMLDSDPERIFLLNYPQILMIFDTILARFMVRLTCEILRFQPRDNLPSWDLICDVYKWGDKLIATYGSVAYSVIGEFESFVTSAFVTYSESDPLLLGVDYLRSVLKTAQENEQLYGVPASFTLEILSILRGVTSANWLSELFGLRKHWGNPIVDAAESGRAIQEKVEEELSISFSANVKLLASFNRMITLEFIRIHGCWPECTLILKDDGYPLYRAWLKRTTRLPETHPDHNHLHWALLKFKKNCILDTYEDVLRLITDKSVSVYANHLDSTYVRALSAVTSSTEVEEDRRLVLEYLRRPHMSVVDIFKVIMTGATPSNWLANSAAMKGTEMKYLKARVFAVLTYEIRQYFAATEDILKTCVFKYNPHQTMTLSEYELLDRLKAVTKQLDPSNNSRFLSVIHIVDFSKWNLRMRYENTHLVFKSIDDFLGTPGLIESTHLLFSDMINIIQDPFNPPKTGVLSTESDTIWRFHNCGWEGQRQKGWTLLTSALLSDLSRLTGVNSLICGQGDNQTLLSQFPVPSRYINALDWICSDGQNVRVMLDDFYKKLESECSLVGLKIKTAESCRSLCYFNYGKRLYFSGVELSMTLKRISKIMTEPNDSYPTTEFILKTLEGAAYASNIYSHPSILPYLMSRISVSLQLHSSFYDNQLIGDAGKRELLKLGLSFNTRWLQILLRIPASLGGVPQLPFSAYLFRGHPDPLCTDLVMLVLRAKAGCDISKKIIQTVLSKKWFNSGEERDLKASLIMSPYSLNLNTLPSARTPLDKEILPSLKTLCNNPLLSSMFSFEVDEMSDTILDLLSNLIPFHPIVANDIFTRSLPGRRQTFISGLANTTSLGRLVVESRCDPIVGRIANLEFIQLKSWINRTLDLITTCTVESGDLPSHWHLAQWCRDKSWGCEIVGVTVPHPLEQFVLVSSIQDMCNSECMRFENEHIVIVRHSENLIELPGLDGTHMTTRRSRSGDPYLGSTVSEGVVQKTVYCLNPDTTWRDVIRLNTLRKWICQAGSVIDDLLVRIIESRTDVDMHIIEASTGVPSRLSYNHRAALMTAVLTCSVASTTNMYTRLYLSSNRMGEFSHGDVNFHMPFGPAFLCLQHLVCLISLDTTDPMWARERVVFHAHIRDRNIPTVFDEKMEIGQRLHVQFPKVSTPEILYSNKHYMKFSLIGALPSEHVWSDPDLASLEEMQLAYAHQLIGDSFVRETSVRETITLNLFHGFSTRQRSVSVGDIELISPGILIKALAWNFLLLSPYNVWCSKNDSSTLVLARQFVDGFSMDFWNPFLPPFCVPRLSAQLVTRCQEAISFNMTRSSSGIISVLRTLIVLEMNLIKQRMLSSCLSFAPTFEIAIYSPSFASLKLLWSKYIEMQLSMILSSEDIKYQTVIALARDFSANILSSSDEHFSQVLCHVKYDIHLLMKSLSITRVGAVDIRFFDLKEPWIDRLRWREKSRDEQLTFNATNEHQIPDLYPPYGLCFSYTKPDFAVCSPIISCSCPESERSRTQHIESFHTLSGHLSKSHLRFLDLVLQYKLSLKSVVVLGSSTGTEALSFSRFAECERVYVNCFHPISEFSPHMAGSYIPPAFILSGSTNKLINSTQAVTASSDLLMEETTAAIIDHTSGHEFRGLTCDVEVPYDFPLTQILTLIRNVMIICTNTKLNDWSIIKVPAKCEHELSAMMSIVSWVYNKVTVCKSIFSRPGIDLFYVIGHNGQRPNNNCIFSNTMPVCLTSDERLGDFVTASNNVEVPPLYNAGVLVVQSRKWLNTILPNSLITACNSYVSGFGLLYYTPPSITVLKRDILSTLQYLDQEAKTQLQLFQRTHQESNLPRTAILGLERTPLHKSLDHLFAKMNRLELLHSVLLQEEFNLFQTMDHIEDWCIITHEYSMTTRKYKYHLDASRLINHYTRHLYEILGHVYTGNAMNFVTPKFSKLYHRAAFRRNEIFIENLPPKFDLTSVRKRPNLLWKWERRSEILFWLLSHHIMQIQLFISSPNYHLIRDCQLDSLIPCLTDCMPSTVLTANTVWVDSHEDLNRLQVPLTSPLCLSLPVSLVPKLLRLSDHHIIYFKLPWSGLSPDRVLAFVKLESEVESDGRSDYNNYPSRDPILYPDTTQFVYHYNELGESIMNCACVDCATEVLLLRGTLCSHSTLDRICSLKAVETLRNKVHVL